MGFLFLMATNCQLGTKAHALCATEETEGSLLIAEARRVNAYRERLVIIINIVSSHVSAFQKVAMVMSTVQ